MNQLEQGGFSEKELPYSIEAEQSILGAILVNSDVLPTVVDLISPECFYNEQHRQLYGIMLRLFTSGSQADIVVVLNEALQARIFENAQEGRKYLAALVDQMPSVSNVASYCKIVAEKYYIRSLAYVAREVLDRVADGGDDAQTLLDWSEQKIFDIRQGKDVRGLIPISEVIVEAYDTIGKMAGPDREKYIGARTGFSMLDAITSGLNKSDLILIAARPAMGKTAFALNIGVNVAKKYKKTVAIFNLEMSREQLAMRLLASEGFVELQKLATGKLSEDEWSKLCMASAALSQTDIRIDDNPSVTVADINAKCRRLDNLGLVIIDYLQLMQGSGYGKNSDNRVTVVGEISRSLKIMAKELDVPVICLSQLSRAVESRTDKNIITKIPRTRAWRSASSPRTVTAKPAR